MTISLHPLLDALEVVGGERAADVEVVVEAVLDRRADAELGLGEELLHGLRHHVRGGVPQDREAVARVDRDRLDLVAVAQLVRQVAQLAVDPGGYHRAVVGEEVGRSRARGHGPLGSVAGLDDVDTQVGHGE